jgi:hypothetical protein
VTTPDHESDTPPTVPHDAEITPACCTPFRQILQHPDYLSHAPDCRVGRGECMRPGCPFLDPNYTVPDGSGECSNPHCNDDDEYKDQSDAYVARFVPCWPAHQYVGECTTPACFPCCGGVTYDDLGLKHAFECPSGAWRLQPLEPPPPVGPVWAGRWGGRRFLAHGAEEAGRVADALVADRWTSVNYGYDTEAARWLVRGADRWYYGDKNTALVITQAAADRIPSDWGPHVRDLVTRPAVAAALTARAASGWQPLNSDHRQMPGLDVRGSELDTDPTLLWAGGYPWDLAASERVPVCAYWTRDEARWFDVHLKSARYLPDITVPTPGWHAITAAIFPDEAAREHALSAQAHGLTGFSGKHVPFLRAETNLGKSLLLGLLLDLLGNYARTIPAKVLFGSTADPQRAAQELDGVRLAVVDEGLRHGYGSAEAFKFVTSGGRELNARRLYEESRQVAATHTLVLACNPEADLNYRDPAVRARLVPALLDGDPDEIRDIARWYNPGSAAWKAEAPGVLAQMIVRASRAIGDPGYGTNQDIPPQCAAQLNDATALAHLDDPVVRWLASGFVKKTDGREAATPTASLFEECVSWCRWKGEKPPSAVEFGRTLKRLEIDPARIGSKQTRGWQLSLTSAERPWRKP